MSKEIDGEAAENWKTDVQSLLREPDCSTEKVRNYIDAIPVGKITERKRQEVLELLADLEDDNQMKSFLVAVDYELSRDPKYIRDPETFKKILIEEFGLTKSPFSKKELLRMGERGIIRLTSGDYPGASLHDGRDRYLLLEDDSIVQLFLMIAGEGKLMMPEGYLH